MLNTNFFQLDIDKFQVIIQNRFNKYWLPLLPMKMERENDFDSNNIEGQLTPCVMPVYKVKCKPEKARIRQVC